MVHSNKLFIFSLIIVLIFTFVIVNAQQIKSIKNITGTYYISEDISPNQAKKNALNDAKINALKQAGIEEQINSYQLLFKSEIKNDYSDFFSSEIQSEMQGAIKSYEIKKSKNYCKSETEIICEVTIDATVIKYDTKPDISFDTYIEGIKSIYNNDDKLSFSVKTTQKSYLTIFNITDKEAFVLFPNSTEKQEILNSNETYKFPSKMSYTLFTDMKQQETNRLIFVFTKSPISFIKMDKDQNTTSENIFNWIYSISPDQRKVTYITYVILK